MKTTDKPGQDSANPYHSLIGASVLDRNGTRASIRSLYRKGDATIAVLAMEDGRTTDADLSGFERQEDGFFTSQLLERRREQQPPAPEEWHEEMSIPVAKEKISIDKRRVETGKGIRVRKHVLEHEEIVNLPHTEESLSVRHVEVGQIVSEDNLPRPRQEGDTYIIPVFEEVYVVEKRIRLKEEVHIRTERKESRQEEKIKLRSEQVGIERFDDDASRD